MGVPATSVGMMATQSWSSPVRTRRLPNLPALCATQVLHHLQRPGLDLELVPSTASTNDDLMDRARAGAPERPILRVAEFQSAGRGRLGRRWHAPPGSALLFSVALAWPREPARSAAVSLACGLAAAHCLRAGGIAVALKWPNDLLLDGRKLAGLLAQIAEDGRGVRTLIVGMGVNVVADARLQQTVGHPIADLAQCLGREAAIARREYWLGLLAAALLDAAQDFVLRGFAPLREAYNAAFAYRGMPVQLHSSAGPGDAGIALGVDELGNLVLDCAGARRTIGSGELSLRPAGDPSGQTAAAA